jgi:hypothetical protein
MACLKSELVNYAKVLDSKFPNFITLGMGSFNKLFSHSVKDMYIEGSQSPNIKHPKGIALYQDHLQRQPLFDNFNKEIS